MFGVRNHPNQVSDQTVRSAQSDQRRAVHAGVARHAAQGPRDAPRSEPLRVLAVELQLLGLKPPLSAWTMNEPSDLTISSRSACGRTAFKAAAVADLAASDDQAQGSGR